jgi:hypothetical protein
MRGIARADANVNVLGLRFRDIGIGAIGGGVLGGPAGVGIAMANKLAQTDRGLLLRAEIGEQLKAKQLSAIRAMAGKVQTQIATSARAALTTGTQVGRITAVRQMETALAEPIDRDSPHQPNGKTRQALFQARAKEVSSLVSSPERLTATIAREHENWRDAQPGVADALSAARTKALSFIWEKMPKNPSAGKTLNPDIEGWQPSDHDIAKWEIYLETVRNPMSAIEDLEAGKISPEQVETLKAIYPKIYDHVVDELVDGLSTLQLVLPYERRLQLSVLFDVPVEESVDAPFLAELQQMQTSEEAAEGAGQAPRQSAGKPLSAKFGQNIATPSQRMELR